MDPGGLEIWGRGGLEIPERSERSERSVGGGVSGELGANTGESLGLHRGLMFRN